jgi:hypothetical protein
MHFPVARHVWTGKQFVEQTPGAGIDHVADRFPVHALQQASRDRVPVGHEGRHSLRIEDQMQRFGSDSARWPRFSINARACADSAASAGAAGTAPCQSASISARCTPCFNASAVWRRDSRRVDVVVHCTDYIPCNRRGSNACRLWPITRRQARGHPASDLTAPLPPGSFPHALPHRAGDRRVPATPRAPRQADTGQSRHSS